MWTRRQFLTKSSLAMLGATGTALAFPGVGEREAMPDGSQARGMMTGECEDAIKRGLEFLANRQAADGWWGTGVYGANVAVSSLGAIAMMAGGSHPGRGKYGDRVKSALQFVLRQGDLPGRPGMHPPGFLHNSQHGGQQGPMYSHGFGTLFLGEVCGMVADSPLREQVRQALARAVQVTLHAQTLAGNAKGGWRYNPMPGDADISVTVCQIMALRSARNAGVFVPKSVVDRCIDYVKASQNPDGSFMYQRNNVGFPFGNMGGGFGARRRAWRPCTVPASTAGRPSTWRSATSSIIVRCGGAGRWTCTISTAITMPSRPCGPPAGSTGPTGSPPSATNWSAAN